MSDDLLERLRHRLQASDDALLRRALARIETLQEYERLYYELLNAAGPKHPWNASAAERHRLLLARLPSPD